MANLTSKELSALEDQLGFEKLMTCKYQAAAQTAADTGLKQKYQDYAGRHQRNYTNLLNFLK